MLIQLLTLAISSSIDSLGIGITYGLKNTRISLIAKYILFIISIVITSISILIGTFLNSILPNNVSNFFGSLALFLIGIWFIYQFFPKNRSKDIDITPNKKKIYNIFIKSFGVTIRIIREPEYSDFDNSKQIDFREAIYLGLALSLDSFSIGVGSGIIGFNSFLFPILVATSQLLFLSFGIVVGRYFGKASEIPNNLSSAISGVILIIIGVLRLLL